MLDLFSLAGENNGMFYQLVREVILLFKLSCHAQLGDLQSLSFFDRCDFLFAFRATEDAVMRQNQT